MEISQKDSVKNKEVLHRVKDKRNIQHAIKREQDNWIGHGLPRNCHPKHIIE
jgi:hypothetical protein